jgi:ABC-type Fe3+-hydroxamate transport system substrate-binding protein
MRWRISIGALIAALTLPQIAATGIQLNLSRTDIEAALKVVRGPETQRRQFHAAYQIPVNDAFVETIEIVTPYRRVVLLAEQRIAAGEWAFGLSSRWAEAALRPWKDTVAVRARIRFHPQNVYPHVPEIDVTMGAGPDLLVPLHTATDPRYAPGNYVAGAAPLIGADAEADFDAARIGQRVMDVAVRVQGGSEVRRAVDFGSLK